jgi:prepilin-type N-terminal cleavage/methylation domain-containing protein
MRRINTKSSRGFTIIELLIATVVFSVVMLVVLAAFVRTGDLFYKGVSMMNTQEDTRNIVQSISQDISFTKMAPPNMTANITTAPAGVFCVGNHRYRYQIGQQVNSSSSYGLARDTISFSAGCPPLSGPNSLAVQTATDTRMLDSGMQLNYLNINCTGGRCSVNVHVVFYGGDSTLPSADSFFTSAKYPSHPSQGQDAECIGSLNDSKLCATADFDSTVLENT